MERVPKRRVLSLSLSQQGKEGRRTRTQRNRSAAKSYDSSPLDHNVEESVIKIQRNISEPDSHDASTVSCDKQVFNSSPSLSILTVNSKGSASFKSPQHDAKNVCVKRVVKSDVKVVDNVTASQSLTLPLNNLTRTLEQPAKPSEAAESSHVEYYNQTTSKHELQIDKIQMYKEIFTDLSCSKKCDSREAPEIKSESSENILSENFQKLESEKSGLKSKAQEVSLKTEAEYSILAEVGNKPADSLEHLSDELEVLQCPFCFKNFDKKHNKSAHLKACAMKHGMTTRQLLDALDLQRRQTAERKALGLPTSAAAPSKLKSRKDNRSGQGRRMDSGLQLAMALSLSLHDQEKSSSFKEGLQGNGPSLESFGFVNKPVLETADTNKVPTSYKCKAKASVKRAPVLLTRTAEERQQIITEKVAMVLMEEIDLTEQESSTKINLESELLQQYHNKDMLLWGKSQLSPSKADRASYYVQELRGFISPSKVETGSKVMHISQVAGRIQTPEKEENKSNKINSPEDERHLQTTKLACEGSESDSDSSKSVLSFRCSPNSPDSIPKLEMMLRAKLFNDWAGMVNNSSMSDLVIYPQEGREIHTHQLLLFVRCREMLHDIIKQTDPITGNDVQVIVWCKIPYAAAIAFLEYLYCGSVKSIPALSDDLSSIEWLASHYKVRDLLRYLRLISDTRVPPSQAAIIAASDLEAHKTPCIDSPSRRLSYSTATDSEVSSEKGEDVTVLSGKNGDCGVSSVKDLDINVLPQEEPDSGVKPDKLSKDIFQSPCRSEDSIYSQPTERGSQRSLSPDLFDDEADDMSCSIQGELREHHSNLMSSSVGENHIDALVFCPESSKRQPSPQLSTCSERTLILNADSSSRDACERPPSRQLSTCSAGTVILMPNSPHSSPDVSESVVLRVSSSDSDCSFGTSPNTTDPKRKLSSHSNNYEEFPSKRLCSRNSSQEKISLQKDPDTKSPDNIELYDLTQDSNSEKGPLSGGRRSSKDSDESIVITSDVDNQVYDENCKGSNMISSETDRSEQAALALNVDFNPAECSPNKSGKKSSISNELELKSTSPDQDCSMTSIEGRRVGEPYISPIWDGFEDLNCDEPCFAAIDPEMDLNKTPNSSERIHLSLVDLPSSSREKENYFEEPTDMIPQTDSRITLKDQVQRGCEETADSLTNAKGILEKASCFFGMLLDDSFNNMLTDSVLQNAEKVCVDVAKVTTPKCSNSTPVRDSLVKEAVTPLADYSAMKTPELKRELKKFGLKPSLGKRKGKLMLRHIYNELHPWVPLPNAKSCEEKISLSQPIYLKDPKAVSLSQPSTSKKQISSDVDSLLGSKGVAQIESSNSEEESDLNRSSSSSSDNYHEGSFLEDWENDLEPLSQATSQTVGRNLWRDIQDFISGDPQLHQKVLEYEPIWIEKLQGDLRSHGLKIKMADLMAILDEKCITFRTVSSGPRIKKKKGKNVPKKSSTHDMDEAELSV